MRILLIEDEAPIATVIRRGLEGARYVVDVTADGVSGLRMAEEHSYSLIILDLMLPGMDGYMVCERLRASRSTPILMLTARDSAEERIRGLELGADDYLAKPFHFGELLARVQALIRRGEVHKTRYIRLADLEIDTTSGHVLRAGAPVPLTRIEFELLEALAVNEGRVLSMQSLRERLEGEEGAARAELELESLREKIDDDRPMKLRLIHTVGGVGYTLHAAP